MTKSAKWKASHPAPFSASTYLHISFPVSLFTTLMYASFTSEKVFLPSPKNLNIFAYRAIFCTLESNLSKSMYITSLSPAPPPTKSSPLSLTDLFLLSFIPKYTVSICLSFESNKYAIVSKSILVIHPKPTSRCFSPTSFFVKSIVCPLLKLIIIPLLAFTCKLNFFTFKLPFSY